MTIDHAAGTRLSARIDTEDSSLLRSSQPLLARSAQRGARRAFYLCFALGLGACSSDPAPVMPDPVAEPLRCAGTQALRCPESFTCVDDTTDSCDPGWGDVSCPGLCVRGTPSARHPSSYTLFESGQVRPLAKSPDGKLLFAVNTPDSRLEVYRIGQQKLDYVDSIPVGLEPVAVAARTNDEVWVVNHLSDSVSIVNVGAAPRRVVRTLLVGDEPRDIVFAGTDRNRAFITTAHRGQNVPYDPQLTTPSVGRADVWVFDADHALQSTALAAEPLSIVQLFSDTPRALAVSPDGSRVYAAGFMTGNRTTTIPQEVVTQNGGLPSPVKNYQGIQQPDASLIVRFDGTHWLDELGRVWDQFVKFSLPDKDVFVIDANANPPTRVAGTGGYYTDVGTILYNMAVNPKSGRVYVSNTEARNQVRFEGSGTTAGSSVRGHLHESRISILGNAGQVSRRHLNKHIDYKSCCQSTPNDENARSLAFPTGMEVSSDGATLYVAAFGSSKVGRYSTAALENDSFVPAIADQITVSGGGPTGLLLDEARAQLFVLTRFNNAIAIIDTASGTERASIPLYNPEPESAVRGRRFLYDAARSSAHGDSACASCHVFGDLDALAWDLGDPDSKEVNNPGPFALEPSKVGSMENVNFRPHKGPMTTQSLRGMANHGPMHWRGDRTGGNQAPSAQPDSGTFDEHAAFREFNPAFASLLGRSAPLTDDELQQFTDFALQITYPPNPVRNLDNSLTASQQAGHDFYMKSVSDRLFACKGCHVLDPQGNAEFGVAQPGFFGTDGRSSFEFEPQIMKVPHLRNLYQKVGMFGMPTTSKLLPDAADGSNHFMGEQIRGFGFLHDGSHDTIHRFLTSILFRFVPAGPGDPGNPGGFSLDEVLGAAKRGEVEQFLLAYDSNLAPVVGQQVTLGAHNWEAAQGRVNLLVRQADKGECELVARVSSRQGYLYVGGGMFRSSRSQEAVIPDNALRQAARRHNLELTFTCVPPGSGMRLGLDRNSDGILDQDEALGPGATGALPRLRLRP